MTDEENEITDDESDDESEDSSGGFGSGFLSDDFATGSEDN